LVGVDLEFQRLAVAGDFFWAKIGQLNTAPNAACQLGKHPENLAYGGVDEL